MGPEITPAEVLVGRLNYLTTWGWFLGLQQVVTEKKVSDQRSEREGAPSAWGWGCCSNRSGVAEPWGTRKNEPHFLQVGVLELSCRRANKFCFLTSDSWHTAACVQSSSEQRIPAQVPVKDRQVTEPCMIVPWDPLALHEDPSVEVSCALLLHSCYEGFPNLDTCPYRCSLLMLEKSLRQTVDLYLSLL